MTNKLYEQYDEESIDGLKREIIELKAEITTLKTQMRDMG